MTEYQAHPVADLFPLLPDDELKELAEDISANGLLQPIVLDNEGRVLDGRNRLRACELAGVEPGFETYDGEDADAYALSVNLARRHLTKGQRAMVAARALCILHNGTQAKAANRAEVDQGRVSRASTVLAHAPDLAEQVLAGATPLETAYQEARDRKIRSDSAETQLASLREQAPDLADLVSEERLTLKGAIEEARRRQAAEEETRKVAASNLDAILRYLDHGPISVEEYANRWAGHLDHIDVERINEAVAVLAAIAKGGGNRS